MAYDLFSKKRTDRDYSIGVSETDMMGFSLFDEIKKMPIEFKVGAGIGIGLGLFMFADWYKNSRNFVVPRPRRETHETIVGKTHQLPHGETMDEIVKRRLR